MKKFEIGDVVIVGTGQAGTIVSVGKNIEVLLINKDIWYGFESQVRYPQDAADLAACPLEFDKYSK
jgi:preprotein translocase subunit YajC